MYEKQPSMAKDFESETINDTQKKRGEYMNQKEHDEIMSLIDEYSHYIKQIWPLIEKATQPRYTFKGVERLPSNSDYNKA